MPVYAAELLNPRNQPLDQQLLQQMFYPEEFRNAITTGQSDSFQQVLKKLIYTVQNEEQMYAQRMVQEISSIIKSQFESPVLKFKVAKVIMYIILLAQPLLLKQFQQKIYPSIKNSCLFNRTQPIITRGMDFFKNNKYYEIANFEQKSKIKNIGCRYIIFCLQCVYMLAEWLPKDHQTCKPSLFQSSYQMLLKEGVEFPNPSELTFFTEQRIKSIEQQLQQCQQQATKIKHRHQEEYFDSGKSKFDAANMNGVEYLQKKLKQKDKIIKDMRNNGSVYEVHKHSAIQKFKQQERDNLQKIQAYEEKVAQLTQQVREMKQILKLQKHNQTHQNKFSITDLEAKVHLLSYENSRLKEELAKKSSLLFQRTHREEKSQTNSISRVQSLQHIKQLIEITKQPHQTLQSQNNQNFVSYKRQKKPQNIEFQQKKSIQQLLYPIYDALSRQSQMRLRRCLLKSKQILYKNQFIEVGMISTLKTEIELEITVIITNITDQILSFQGVNFQSTKQLSIITLNNSSLKRLKPDEQIKIQLKAQVNHLDSKCVTFLIPYSIKGQEAQEIPLIMPVSRIKLLKYLSYTSFKDSQYRKLIREIRTEKKVISNVDKLKNYIPKCFVEKHINSEQFCYKVQLLSQTFYLKLQPLLDRRLLFKIYFKEPHRVLAQKLLDDFTFVIAE